MANRLVSGPVPSNNDPEANLNDTEMNERPLSPHLQVYRLPITAILSISHRATGVLLSVGLLFGAWILVAAADGPDSFEFVRRMLATPIGVAILWAWIYAFLFHLCHGLRHLLWDLGLGFGRNTMLRFSILEIGASFFLWLVVGVTTLAIR